MVTRARSALRIVAQFRRRDGTIAHATQKRGNRNVTYIIRHCASCGSVFFAVRSDAVTCSDRCRQRVYRARVKAQKQQHIDRLEQLRLKGVL